MPVSGLTVYLTLNDEQRSSVNIGSVATGLTVRDGREPSEFYDDPGSLMVRAVVRDDFITDDGTGTHRVRDLLGASVSASVTNTELGGSATFWEGVVIAAHASPEITGDQREITIEALSFVGRLARAEQTFDARLRAVREGNIEIDLTGIVASPKGIASNDTLLLIADDTTNKVFAWGVNSLGRLTTSDFLLDANNDTPVGIATDGENRIWVADADRTIYAYDNSPRFERYSSADLTFTRDPLSLVWSENLFGDPQVAYIPINSTKAYAQNNSEVFDLDANNTAPRGATVRPYDDDGVTKHEVLVYSPTPGVIYRYRGEGDGWVRDSAKDWDEPSGWLRNSRVQEVSGNILRGDNNTAQVWEAYTTADPPVRQSSRDLTLPPDRRKEGIACFKDALMVKLREPLGGHSFRWYSYAGSGAPTLSRTTTGFSLTGQELAAYSYKTGEAIDKGSSIGLDPNIARLYSQATDTPTTVFTLQSVRGEARNYAMSDQFIFVASDSRVDVYNLTGVHGARVPLRVDAQSLYWGRDRMFVRWAGRAPHKDFNLDAADGNRFPEGAWTDGTTIWVVDGLDAKIFAYTSATGVRVRDKEITLSPPNAHTYNGLWSDGTTIWVSNYQANRLQAYTLDTGVRDTAKDVVLDAGNTHPSGIWSDGTTIWVADFDDDKVYAYVLATGARDATNDFTLHQDNRYPTGMWSDGTTLWLGEGRRRVFAYNLATKAFDLRKSFVWGVMADALLWGLCSDGDILWATDRSADKLFAINLEAVRGKRWQAYRATFSTSMIPWSFDGSEAVGAGLDITFAAGLVWLLDHANNHVFGWDGAGFPRSIAVTEVGTDSAMTTDGEFLFIQDISSSLPQHKCFAYRISDGRYTPTQDFTFSHASARGMTYDAINKILHVGVTNGTHAYRRPDGISETIRNAPGDFTSEAVPSGITFANNLIYISSATDNVIKAYTTNGVRHAPADIASGNAGESYVGLTSDSSRIYALAASRKVFVWDATTREQLTSAQFALLETATSVDGISVRGGKLFVTVTVGTSKRVWVYNLESVNFISRPRETSSERWRAIALAAAPNTVLPPAPTSRRVLPAREISGTVRDALRRVIDSDLGRAVARRLFTRGTWRINEANDKPSGLTADVAALTISDAARFGEATPITAIRRFEVDALLSNQVIAEDLDGGTATETDTRSTDAYGRHALDVATDVGAETARAIAEWKLRTFANPYTVHEVTLDLLHEETAVATAALMALPHTPVTLRFTPAGSTLEVTTTKIVLNRVVSMNQVGDETEVTATFQLVSPRLFGIGWTLDGPEQLQEDVLGVYTFLVDPEL